MKKVLCIITALMLLLPLSSCQTQERQVWMNVFRPADLTDTGEWEYVSQHVDTVSVFIDQLHQTDIETTTKFADMLSRTGRKLSVECAGIADWYADYYDPRTDTLGKMSAEYEIYELRRLKQAGKDPDYVVFDHPVTRAIYPDDDYSQPPRMTYADAAKQLAYAMRRWRDEYPNIKFIYCVNFPNHGWKGAPAYYRLVDEYGRGDFFEELKAVITVTRKQGLDFYALLADNPYDYATGVRYSTQTETVENTDWMARILDLENEARNTYGLKFALFFNSETPGNNGPEGEYYKQTISFINDYTALGGSPDIFFIESWYKYPLKYVPETKPYSMAYLTKDVIKQVKYAQPADLSNIDMSDMPAPVIPPSDGNWQFDSGVEGWVDISDIDEMHWVSGALRMTCSGNDPYIISGDNLGIDASSYPALHIRIKRLAAPGVSAGSLAVYFTTEDDPVMDGRKIFITDMTSGSDYRDIYFSLGTNSLWSGTIRRLRVDPGDVPGEVWIDSITLE